MADHTICSHRHRSSPPKPPTRIDLEAEIAQCRNELEEELNDGFLVVGRVCLILAVIVGCSLAYWAVTQLN